MYPLLAGVLAATENQPANPILPETSEIVWGSIAFVVLLVVLIKFALPPVRAAMDARTERIRKNIDEADQVKAEAESILADYQRQLADARNESARIIEEARQTADAMRRDLVQRAEAEATEVRQRAQEEAAASAERVMVDLRARVAELSIELAEKVVERNLDRDTQLALIESYINQVDSSRG
jgi:F-type H+-transporting ATPase subunit b